MGFTPQQARIALAATDTGMDVDQALETLLANTEETENVEARDLDRPTPPRRSAAPHPSSRPRREREPEVLIRRQQVASETSPDSGYNSQSYQEQADKLISQATVIGRGMFNKANAIWKESKDRMQKAYEERQALQQALEKSERSGRPKWMMEEESGSGPVSRGESDFEERPERAEGDRPGGFQCIAVEIVTDKWNLSIRTTKERCTRT